MRPNRFLIVFRARKDPKSDQLTMVVESHYRSMEHVNRRMLTITKSRCLASEPMVFEYLPHTFSYPGTGIKAQWIIDGKPTRLVPLRELL